MNMLCRKLKSHRQRSKVSVFTFLVCFCYFLRGEYVFNWDSQIEAIRALASHGNLREVEEVGEVLLSGFEEGQVV
jgi:hypothetical protein